MVSVAALFPLARPTVRMLPVSVTALSPLTVSFPDGSSHAAVGVVGLTYSGSRFIALVQDGRAPLVVPVGTTTSGGVITG